jgi:hypothetical protein
MPSRRSRSIGKGCVNTSKAGGKSAFTRGPKQRRLDVPNPTLQQLGAALRDFVVHGRPAASAAERGRSASAVIVIVAGCGVSFDILFHTCNLGTRKKRVTNPFTRAPMTTFDDPGLTADERTAIATLLKRLKAVGPNEFGFYGLVFPDGGEADLCADGLRTGGKIAGCSVETRTLTADVAGFLFRLSRVGNMILLAVAEGSRPLVTSTAQRDRVVFRFPDVKVIRSPAAMEKELRPGFEAWRRYRDQVVGDEV